MNINRNNYEEYFIMYTDKELSVADKIAVEQFVKNNPDLLEEFRSFQQIKLVPDSIYFANKAALLKTEPFINTSNYEEFFLLYTDNELSAEEITEVEKFAASTPALQQEFDLIQQTILVADSNITFPDKSSLYKKEKPTRVIPINWMRFAAAAVVIGIIILSGILILNKKPTGDKSELVKKETPSRSNNSQPVKPPVLNQQPAVEQNVAATQSKKNEVIKKEGIVRQSSKQNIVVTSNVKENKKQNNDVTNQNSITSSLVKNEENNELKKTNEASEIKTNNINTEVITKADAPKELKTTKEIVDIAVGPSEINKYAQTAVNEEEEKTKTSIGMFSVSEEKVQKSGLRGLFRKVKRLVDRRGNNNEEKDKKLYIGSFAIALAK